MERLISVKGTGKVSQKPDWVVISITLQTLKKEYLDSYNTAADKISKLNDAIMSAGFDKESLKTSRFNINTEYKNVKDSDGNYTEIFQGYRCLHELHFGFAFDAKRLSEALAVIANSGVEPKFSIRFTAKDAKEIELKMLATAAKDAETKAKTLCEAIGAKLGRLVRITYNWDEIDIISHTHFETLCDDGVGSAMDLTPEDIEVEDEVSFEWEIVTD